MLICDSTLSLPELRIKSGGHALNALQRLLNFFEIDVSNVNFDGLFCLRIAQANISLNEIARKKSLYLRRFSLLASRPFIIEYETKKINKSFIENGESKESYFDGEQSDKCFGELLGSNDRSNSTKCFISESRWNMI
ncbi:unnamed protein product [Didymodactylos carnosus]|uniref:Uncharacterized protein n=1 Tax=Didymodactylos carnosus TaxID=1234261 RepID=A0A815G5V7_9BILA|nr:unnamed protein product [Didymodactylos carnosus]CAF1334808.1 unnamed protein product [Didymodactylos carnosus]CAF3996566.1 unnamed protein product [Didymodactylos carnosus]CAF4191167.1 unnamed protein product [Didymodactylos carnosus]